MPQIPRAAIPILAIAVVALFAADRVPGHEIVPSVSDVTVGNGTVAIEIRTNLEALIAGIGPAHDDTDESPNADAYNTLRALSPAELTERFETFRGDLEDGLSVAVDGAPVRATVSRIEIPEVGDVEMTRTTRLTLGVPLPAGARTLTFGWDAGFGDIVVRALDQQGEGYVAMLGGGDTTDPIDLQALTPPGWPSVLAAYVWTGFDHILPKGLDHILFVVGIFLLSTRVRPILVQVTAFTLAHTVTLALGMLGIVRIAPEIVEPLIAASIVYVAVENILRPDLSAWRPLVVFCFGLLHGLGFAGVLTEYGIPGGQFLPALVGFNIGVELGQLTVIAICFALVGYWFGNRPWYRARITIPASVTVAIIGAYWVAERTILA